MFGCLADSESWCCLTIIERDGFRCSGNHLIDPDTFMVAWALHHIITTNLKFNHILFLLDFKAYSPRLLKVQPLIRQMSRRSPAGKLLDICQGGATGIFFLPRTEIMTMKKDATSVRQDRWNILGGDRPTAGGGLRLIIWFFIFLEQNEWKWFRLEKEYKKRKNPIWGSFSFNVTQLIKY